MWREGRWISLLHFMVRKMCSSNNHGPCPTQTTTHIWRREKRMVKIGRDFLELGVAFPDIPSS
ncbi:hypothetical protein Syun_028003 [Stephania yunnanensis]|uniref:Uncharacterized protein n=1 Tax=Stephania yunnanensis TaxID=152371 RepID=A0AAP0ELS0_9MAGN